MFTIHLKCFHSPSLLISCAIKENNPSWRHNKDHWLCTLKGKCMYLWIQPLYQLGHKSTVPLGTDCSLGFYAGRETNDGDGQACQISATRTTNIVSEVVHAGYPGRMGEQFTSATQRRSIRSNLISSGPWRKAEAIQVQQIGHTAQSQLEHTLVMATSSTMSVQGLLHL